MGRFCGHRPAASATVAQDASASYAAGNPYSDRGSTSAATWRAIGTLVHYNLPWGFEDGTFPEGRNAFVDTASVVARAMVARNLWTLAADDPAVYPAIAADPELPRGLTTFVASAGPFPDGASDDPDWGGWAAPGLRGDLARLLWQALDAYYRVDHWP